MSDAVQPPTPTPTLGDSTLRTCPHCHWTGLSDRVVIGLETGLGWCPQCFRPGILKVEIETMPKPGEEMNVTRIRDAADKGQDAGPRDTVRREAAARLGSRDEGLSAVGWAEARRCLDTYGYLGTVMAKAVLTEIDRLNASVERLTEEGREIGRQRDQLSRELETANRLRHENASCAADVMIRAHELKTRMDAAELRARVAEDRSATIKAERDALLEWAVFQPTKPGTQGWHSRSDQPWTFIGHDTKEQAQESLLRRLRQFGWIGSGAKSDGSDPADRRATLGSRDANTANAEKWTAREYSRCLAAEQSMEAARERYIKQGSSVSVGPASNDAACLGLDPAKYRVTIASAGDRLEPWLPTLRAGDGKVSWIPDPAHSSEIYILPSPITPWRGQGPDKIPAEPPPNAPSVPPNAPSVPPDATAGEGADSGRSAVGGSPDGELDALDADGADDADADALDRVGRECEAEQARDRDSASGGIWGQIRWPDATEIDPTQVADISVDLADPFPADGSPESERYRRFAVDPSGREAGAAGQPETTLGKIPSENLNPHLADLRCLYCGQSDWMTRCGLCRACAAKVAAGLERDRREKEREDIKP